MSWGVKPSAMIGHSVGEFVAACLAGVLKLEDALNLIAHRAELVQSMPPGSMLAVRMPEAEVLPFLTPQLAIAAVNSPALCVVAGPHESVDELEKQLSDRGVIAKRLRTSHAFHSQMMDPVIEPFTEVLRSVEYCRSQRSRMSPTSLPSGSLVTDAMSPEYWASHVRKAVRFSDGIEKLLQDPSHVLLEVGPGGGLTQLALQHPSRDKSQRVVTSMPYSEDENSPGVFAALGALWSAGVNLDWQGFYANERRRRVVLPTYPFERTRCWPSTPASRSEAASQFAENVDTTETLKIPTQVDLNRESGRPTSDVRRCGNSSQGPTGCRDPLAVGGTFRFHDFLRGCVGQSLGVRIRFVAVDAGGDTAAKEISHQDYVPAVDGRLYRQSTRSLLTWTLSYRPEPERKPAEPAESPARPDRQTIPSDCREHHTSRPLGMGKTMEAMLRATSRGVDGFTEPDATTACVRRDGLSPLGNSKSGIAIDSQLATALTAVAPRASHGPFKSLDSSKRVH